MSLAALLAPRFARAQIDPGATPVASSAGTPPADAAAPRRADPSNVSIRTQHAGSPPNGWMIAAGSLLATSYAYQIATSVFLAQLSGKSSSGSAWAGNLIPIAGPLVLTIGAAGSSANVGWLIFGTLLAPPLISAIGGFVFLAVGLSRAPPHARATRTFRRAPWTIAMLPLDHGAIFTLGGDWSW